MSFFRWIAGLFRRNKGNNWDGFKAVETTKVDTPEEFRDRNSV